jgi:aspartate-semialdehyde dehydrogenase
MITKFIPLFFFIALLSGCMKDPVHDDLSKYIQVQLKEVIPLENKAVESYQSVTGTNYTSDQILYNTLNQEVIPMYIGFVKELKAIHPETKEVQDIHSQYIKAATLQYNAFIKMAEALDEEDQSKVKEVNGMLEEARKIMSKYMNSLDKLAGKHHLTLKDSTNFLSTV